MGLNQYRKQTGAKMSSDKDTFGELFEEFWYLKGDPTFDPKNITVNTEKNEFVEDYSKIVKTQLKYYSSQTEQLSNGELYTKLKTTQQENYII